jgi:CP family cyanate transporter-like MFS transporter
VLSRRLSPAVALIVVALNLRIAVAAVSPVLPQIRHTTGLSSAGAGLLTALPVFCFGAVALAAPWLIRRLGMAPVLGLALVTMLCGYALRLVPSVGTLFVGSAVVGAGIAIGNVLLPGLIKRDFPERRVLMTSLYSVALGGGATAAAGLTVPIEHATGLDWRTTIMLWSVFAVIALVLWAPHVRREQSAGLIETPRIRGLWRDPLAWCVTGFMGLQAFGFYAILSWLPTILELHGISATTAGALLSLSTLAGMVASLFAPTLEPLAPRRGTAVLLSCLVLGVGYAGLVLAPGSVQYVWCILIGAGQGALLALALGYITGRSPDSSHAAQLSTMAQSVGYMIAASGPFVMGALHGISGTWTVPLIVLLVALIPTLAVGIVAARDGHVLTATRF